MVLQIFVLLYDMEYAVPVFALHTDYACLPAVYGSRYGFVQEASQAEAVLLLRFCPLSTQLL